MSDDFDFSPGMPSDEMSEYLQMFLDETAEQLDGLVETLLVLEEDPTHSGHLNEAFRLVHSVKGSSAMMGLDNITVLTHRLENHFERLRSGLVRLDQATMDLILRCIDFLRDCNQKLRAGEALGNAPDLLEELDKLSLLPSVEPASETPVAPVAMPTPSASLREYRVMIRFESDLQLPDLKAELVLARLTELGQIRDTLPARTNLEKVAEHRSLQILIGSEQIPDDIRAAADVAGVEFVEVETNVVTWQERPAVAETHPEPPAPVAAAPEPVTAPAVVAPEPPPPPVVSVPEPPAPVVVVPEPPPPVVVAPEPPPAPIVIPPSAPVAAPAPPVVLAAAPSPAEPEEEEEAVAARAPEAAEAKTRVVETVRVDIERLDNLMNLAGELVVNKARFVQIARQMSPAFKKSSLSGRARAFGESMRRAIAMMKSHHGNGDTSDEAQRWNDHLHEIASEIDALEEQARLWEESRRYFSQITESIDQLTRVSDSLQRGVLDTRMVPVAPLFNRFKRVVRDISHELKKKVNLEIRGETTELDKRMIDELGDPLVHLVRNAIDHGIERADARVARGKPEIGTICLEAAHSGNNVYITIRDDGGGINLEKVRQRVIDRGLLPASAAEALLEQDLIQYIWHPGFSTADVVSDISGRGVGMDIVKTRIAELNGTIDIQSTLGQGTTFTIRLPLTLAIIRSLLFRLRHGMFAVPIDNVREIVSVPVDKIVTIHGRQTFDVRGEFIPLVDIDDVFNWHDVRYQYANYGGTDGNNAKAVDVVVLHNANKTMGLRVDELQGGQDIVIKSLAENFVHIRGLSGASILGDGSVCLLLDVGAAIDMASGPRGIRRTMATV